MLINVDDLCFNNLKSFWTTLAALQPSGVIETEDSVCINTGINDPIYNPIFLKKEAKQIPIPTPNTHSFWYDGKRNKNIPPESTQKLEALMQGVPMMSIRLDKEFNKQTAPDVKISMVVNNQDLQEWMEPIKISFSLSDPMASRYRQCLENAPDRFIHFIVKKNDLVIGAASLFLHNEIAGLYNLAVLPDCRKQGIGTALHHARLNEAKRRGYQYATLQATPMAAGLDSSIGFTTLSEIVVYKC